MKLTLSINQPVLSFRQDAIRLEKKIIRNIKSGKNKKAVVDYSRVLFISRGFADEWLNIKKRLKRKGISILTRHTGASVRMMLRTVERQRKKIAKELKSA